MVTVKSDVGGRMYDRKGKLAVIDPAKPKRILVAGDIHGDLHAFRRTMSLLRQTDIAVFLGDYADRGPSGIEVLEGLMKAVRRMSGRIAALKGNHEDFSPGGNPLFEPCTVIEEAEEKGREWKTLFPVLQAFFDSLSLAALIPGFALLVHGGISEEVDSPAAVESPTKAVTTDILWSDPAPFPGQHPNPRGAGKYFGPDITKNVLAAFGVKYLIRSHEPRKAADGPYLEHDGRVVTTSATSIYGGRPFVLLLETDDLPRSGKAMSDCAVYLG